MKTRIPSALALMVFAATSACASAPGGSDTVATASAVLRDAAGARKGTATLRQNRDNVVFVELDLTGLPPGPHGVHFHERGRCDATGTAAFATAGAHFNPLGRQHGLDNASGPHAGDAPNFTVAGDGSARASFTTDRVSLTAGSTSLFDADGSALVIHSGADDQISQPAGNSGGRIACGVLQE